MLRNTQHPKAKMSTIKIKPQSFVVGERITVGAAIGSTAAVLGYIFPQYAPAIAAAAVPITAIVQVIIVNWRGVSIPNDATTPED